MEITYEQIPQHEYLIDGHPARTYGEWPGQKSNHWRGSLRVIRPSQTQRIFDGTASIPILGRRHFSEHHSEEVKYIPGKRSFPKQRSMENILARPRGLKRVAFHNTMTKMNFDRKHFPPRFGINNEPERLHMKTFHPNGHYRSFHEIAIEKELGQKKRLHFLEDRRNGIDVRSPGDKCYRVSEYLNGFFKDGGLIVGSTNRINFNKTYSKGASNFYETLDFKKKILDKNKLWGNKIKNEMFVYDDNYVKGLGEWEEKVLVEYGDGGDKDKGKDVKGKVGKEGVNTSFGKGKK